MTKNYVLKTIYNDENECINDTLSRIHGQERPKLRLNRTVTEVDRDRDRIQMWTEWCAKNRTVTGIAQP